MKIYLYLCYGYMRVFTVKEWLEYKEVQFVFTDEEAYSVVNRLRDDCCYIRGNIVSILGSSFLYRIINFNLDQIHVSIYKPTKFRHAEGMQIIEVELDALERSVL